MREYAKVLKWIVEHSTDQNALTTAGKLVKRELAEGLVDAAEFAEIVAAGKRTREKLATTMPCETCCARECAHRFCPENAGKMAFIDCLGAK